jgi:HJR/Mrr/RecB family endonuclease
VAVNEIDESEFDKHKPVRNPMLAVIAREVAWYAATKVKLVGAIVYDKSDKDYGYVILAPDKKGNSRWIHGNTSFPDEDEARVELKQEMLKYERTGKFSEKIYSESKGRKVIPEKKTAILFTDINDELKKYLAKHPRALYNLTPRKFEELIASIMEDFGFEVELTKATRDGGRDIIAYMRNMVTSYLTYVECKKYAERNKVGVGIIRQVVGVHNLRNANKSMIVTTSFFTNDAKKEAKRIENSLDLKDYEALKTWLKRYE